MTTRKDFERAAALVACIDDDMARGTTITVFLRFFAWDNRRFDSERFIARIASLRALKGW